MRCSLKWLKLNTIFSDFFFSIREIRGLVRSGESSSLLEVFLIYKCVISIQLFRNDESIYKICHMTLSPQGTQPSNRSMGVAKLATPTSNVSPEVLCNFNPIDYKRRKHLQNLSRDLGASKNAVISNPDLTLLDLGTQPLCGLAIRTSNVSASS